ncbi:MAG: SpoIID/LytB domain-containing protein [Acidobacteriota bacterium]
MNVLATLALLSLPALPHAAPDTVRIGLFTLFKPETLHVRLAAGEAASLDATGLASSRSIARGELIRIRLSGDRLHIVVTGPRTGVKRPAAATEARIVPAAGATLELVLPGRIKREVRGQVSVDAGEGGRGPLRIVLVTDRESAVASVVAAETSRRETEALKALGVVVRTYMLSHSGRHSSQGFDFCDTTHCQLYRGEQDLSDRAASPAVTNAIALTAGQVMTFEGRPVEGYYTAACGGLSATPAMVWGGSSSYPYGRIVCRWCRASRFERWERSATAAAVLNALSSFLASRVSSAAELIADCDQPSGFVRSITVRDGSKRTVLSTDAFRRAIGLRLGWNTVLSPTFTVERRASRFIFRGRGFGSQVGLCEAGAVAQAAAGRSYHEILSFYYPGADISERPAHE